MDERNWFPRGAGQQQLNRTIGTFRCDDPPTTALALEAAIDVRRITEEGRDGERRD